MKLIVTILLLATGLLLQSGYLPPKRSIDPTFILITFSILVLIGWYRLRVGFEIIQKKLDRLSDRTSLVIFFLIFLLSAIYFPLMNHYVGREMHPAMHDDQMHAIQVQMLATGKLWMPQHTQADFFETFHVFIKPLYAPCHFPGTAILNVAGVWFHLPSWFIPNLMMSASVALTFHVTRKIISTTFAFLPPIFLLFSPIHYILAPMIMSQNAMLFLGLLWIAVFIQWRKSCGFRWAIALGLIGGLASITRPVDAIAFGLSILTGILITLYQRRDEKLAIKTLAIGVGCVLPFFLFQLYFNYKITGSATVTPYKLYCDQNFPGTIYPDPSSTSNATTRVSQLQQKQDLYEGFMISTVRHLQQVSTWDELIKMRLPMTLQLTIPNSLLIFLLPLSLLSMNSVNRFVATTPAIFFFILYFPHAFYAEHYVAIIAAPIAFLLLLGTMSMVDLLNKLMKGNWASAFFFILLAACLLQGVRLFQSRPNPFRVYRSVNFVQEQLPSLVESPALVFCQYNAANGANFNDEPVYNYHAAAIDDNPIVLAQSLGPRNVELVDYYHKIGQNRTVYQLDRGSLTLTRIGKVNELIK